MRKMSKIIAAFVLCAVSCATILNSQINTEEKQRQERPVINYVPTEKVACQIAEVILKPIYGEEHIKKQMPFKATLVKDSVWVVVGVQKEIEIGGVASIEIQKRDCKILKVSHGK